MAGKIKLSRRERIKKGIRKRITGSPERPRLSVFRSNKGIYAQIIDDNDGKTLVAASSSEKDFSAKGTKIDQSKKLEKKLQKKQLLLELKKLFLIEMVTCTMAELNLLPKVLVRLV